MAGDIANFDEWGVGGAALIWRWVAGVRRSWEAAVVGTLPAKVVADKLVGATAELQIVSVAGDVTTGIEGWITCRRR